MHGMTRKGEVAAVSALQVKQSPIGLGFEKLDRDVFDPEKAYDKVAALGVKWIRIQSGWAKTEKIPGVYDFGWLDAIVDNLRRRGLEPWMCLCYGNGLYTEAARQVFGAVGCPPISTEEERLAWRRYVAAVTAHFRGRVGWYEVWNEPDGKWCWKHGPDGAEYGAFVKATAAAVREGDPEAKVIGGSMCMMNMQWFHDLLRTGAAGQMDAFSYHAYTPREEETFARLRTIRALCRQYNPRLEIIQGETGCQSRSDGAGALAGGAWTEERQAKFLVRHMVADLLGEVKFASYFSCLDMIEALNGVVGDKGSYLDYGYFGVLRAEFDKDGFSTGEYSPKPSYRALQTVAAVFREGVGVCDLPVVFRPESSPRLLRQDDGADGLLYGAFRKSPGAFAFTYWKPAELLTTSYEGTVTIELAGVTAVPGLVDLLDGSIYEIPAGSVEADGKGVLRLKHLPLRDYPLLLVWGDFI